MAWAKGSSETYWVSNKNRYFLSRDGLLMLLYGLLGLMSEENAKNADFSKLEKKYKRIGWLRLETIEEVIGDNIFVVRLEEVNNFFVSLFRRDVFLYLLIDSVDFVGRK